MPGWPVFCRPPRWTWGLGTTVVTSSRSRTPPMRTTPSSPALFLNAEECAPKAAQCATTVLGVYARHQLRLNPKADKSEFMIILRGPGAKRAAADIAFQDDSVVTAFLYEQEVKFRVVKEYQHMGSVLEAGRRMLPEIVHRGNSMNEHFGAAKSNVYHSRAMAVDGKAACANVFCCNRLLYNAGTWGGLLESELARLRSYYMPVVRAVGGCRHGKDDQHYTNMQALVAADMPEVSDRVSVARFRYVARFCKYAPPPLIRAAVLSRQDFRSWMHALLEDAPRLWYACVYLQSVYPDPTHDTAAFLRCYQARPDETQRDFVRAVKQFHQRFDAPAAAPLAPRDPSELFSCDHCGVQFDTKQKLLTHLAKRHSYMNPLRARLCTTYCAYCGYEFHSPKRILKHLKRWAMSTDCAKYYMGLEPLSEEEIRTFEGSFARTSAKLVPLPVCKRF